MNIHAVPSNLRAAVRDVEARYPIKIVGVLPRGSAVHVSEESAIDLWPRSGSVFPSSPLPRPKPI